MTRITALEKVSSFSLRYQARLNGIECTIISCHICLASWIECSSIRISSDGKSLNRIVPRKILNLNLADLFSTSALGDAPHPAREGLDTNAWPSHQLPPMLELLQDNTAELILTLLREN
jgi:hypothetical protein